MVNDRGGDGAAAAGSDAGPADRALAAARRPARTGEDRNAWGHARTGPLQGSALDRRASLGAARLRGGGLSATRVRAGAV